VITIRNSPPSQRRAIGFMLVSLSVSATLASCAMTRPALNTDRAAMIEAIRQQTSDHPGLARDPHFAETLRAMNQVRREDFVPHAERPFAYRLSPLKIGYAQTISDPAVVATMTAAAAVGRGSSVLEIGTGSGYQAAILGQLGATVHSIEIVPQLARSAAHRLKQMGYSQVSVKAGDGFVGWPEFAPYDAIIVTAGAAEVPAPLLLQMKMGGHLIMPLGPQDPLEQLIRVTKTGDNAYSRCSLGPTMFVPLTGAGQRTPAMKGLYNRQVPPCFGDHTGL
jgi:protein-L-isoaspartate(D-aspartate) O-methyltransferase